MTDRRAARELALPMALVATYALALKALRLARHPAHPSPVEALWLLVPDALAQLGLFGLGLALLACLPAGRSRRTGDLLLRMLALCYAGLVTLAHGFFEASGTSLDASLLVFGLSRPAQMLPALSSQANPAWVALLGALAAGVLGAPGGWRRAGAEPAPGAGEGPGVLRAARWAALGTAACAVSLLPQVPRIDRAFARDPLLQVVAGALATVRPEDALAAPMPRPRGPERVEAAPGAPHPDVVLVLLESTGALATTAYAPELATTPFLAELAAQSLQVERAYGVVPHTSKALVSTLCGFEPSPFLDSAAATTGGLPGRCLPALLAERGYHTAFFMSAEKTYESFDDLAGQLGFQHFESGEDLPTQGFERANYFGYEDAILLPALRRFLREQARPPFFLTVLTNTPHHDYHPPRRYGYRRFSRDPLEDRYLNSIRYLDGFLSELFALLGEAAPRPDPVLVVLGDHGEAFGQHGLFVHDDVVYEEALRIPLLLHQRGNPQLAGRVAGPVNQLDLAPTLLELAGMRAPGGSYAGRSILSPAASDPERVLRAACYRHRSCLARIQGWRKTIDYQGMRAPELYDLESDPGERRSLADGRPAELAADLGDLLSWRAGVRELYRGEGQPLLAQFVGAEPRQPEQPRPARFGPWIEFLGFDPPRGHPRSGFEITYVFRALAPPPPGYELRLVGRAGRASHVFQHAPVRGLYPLSEWQPGRFVTDIHGFEIPPDWSAPYMDLCLELAHPERGPAAVFGAAGERAPSTCVPIGRLDFAAAPRAPGDGGTTAGG